MHHVRFFHVDFSNFVSIFGQLELLSYCWTLNLTLDLIFQSQRHVCHFRSWGLI